MAVIATPAATVPGIIESCGKSGVRAAVVLSAGFGETDEAGPALKQGMLAAARRYGMRLVTSLGFTVETSREDPTVRHVVKPLV